MKKLLYAVTGAVFLGLTAPAIGATGEAWAEEVIGPDVLVPEGYRNGRAGTGCGEGNWTGYPGRGECEQCSW